MLDRNIRRRGVGAALLVAAAHGVATGVLSWGSAGALAAVRGPGQAGPDALVAVGAAGAAWLVLTWLAVGTLLTVGTAVMAGLGSRAHARACAVTPRLARGLASALLGVSVLGCGLAAAGPSAAAAGPPVTVAADRGGTAGTAPARLDRPVATVPGGWTPDRPAAAARRSDGGEAAVRLVTAAPHPERAVTDEVVVRRGDTLWDIAARHLGANPSAAEVAAEWPRWFAANRDLIGPDPDLLVPGQRLRPPPGT